MCVNVTIKYVMLRLTRQKGFEAIAEDNGIGEITLTGTKSFHELNCACFRAVCNTKVYSKRNAGMRPVCR